MTGELEDLELDSEALWRDLLLLAISVHFVQVVDFYCEVLFAALG